jgi:cytochrome bd ubiquinol oxidase subunit II
MKLSLNEFWFLIIAVLFIGFFVLEGFDFGVGMASKVLSRNNLDTRIYLNTIGPFWDANEVWLITAGGAMFAAFPHWYATLFSGFYIPFVFMLLALILRGVAFEFRGKVEDPRWKSWWDTAIFIGSSVTPFLWGVALANFMTGVKIDENKNMFGSFLDLLHPFALVSGVMFLLLCLVHGLQFITIRTVEEHQERARTLGKKVGPVALLFVIAFVVIGSMQTDIFTTHGDAWLALPIAGCVALLASIILNVKKRDGWAFVMTTLTIIFISASVFIGMFPRVLISTLGAAYDLTIYNAASGEYTLRLMSYFSIGLLPFVLGYQIWSYYVFRKRVTAKDHLEY